MLIITMPGILNWTGLNVWVEASSDTLPSSVFILYIVLSNILPPPMLVWLTQGDIHTPLMNLRSLSKTEATFQTPLSDIKR